jgi:hypothetical protein
MPTKSLQMTKQVTEYRKQLEMKLQWIMSAIPSHLTRMEELREKEKFIELHKSEVDANRNFEIKVPVFRNVKQHRWVYQQVEETLTLSRRCSPEIRNGQGKEDGRRGPAVGSETGCRRTKGENNRRNGHHRDLLKSLRHNGLVYGNPVTTRDYVEKMIETERDERQMGFEERIKSLLELSELA